MDLLKSRKITARYLSDKYEISLRSVYRYVDVLSSSGVPVFSERGRHGGITIADNYRLPATLLTKTEQSDVLSALSLYKGADPLCDVDVIRDKLLSVNTSDDAEKLIMSGDKLILEGVIGDEKTLPCENRAAVESNRRKQKSYRRISRPRRRNHNPYDPPARFRAERLRLVRLRLLRTQKRFPNVQNQPHRKVESP